MVRAHGMFILNRPNPITNAIGGGIGFVKEYNADRKSGKLDQEQGSQHEQTEENKDVNDNDDEDHEWALALDEAQQEAHPTPQAGNDDQKTIDDLVDEFINRYPPPPYEGQQPVGRLTLPVVLPQRRPQSRTRGFVRGYAPVLEAAEVTQTAWIDFLDGFEKAINKNNLFWAANAAVWIADKAYIATIGFNVWAKLIVLSIHASVEAGRRAYMHNQYNKYLDQVNDAYFKPRGLYALIIKYKPDQLDELGEWVDVRKNITETVTKRDDPARSKWKAILEASTGKNEHESELPEFAPLIFPAFDGADAKQNESAWKHFQAFRQDYQDRAAQAGFDAKHPESKLANVAPQKEWASRYSNPEHPARQGGLVALVSGGKYNPKSRRQQRHERYAEMDGDTREVDRYAAANRIAGEKSLAAEPTGLARVPSPNVGSGGVDRNEVAWQATRNGQGRNPIRRLLRQDVIYLLVVNMPTPAEMEAVKREVGITEW